MLIAAQMNTVRAFCGTTAQACHTLERLKAAGFEAVEWNYGLLQGLDRAEVAAVQRSLGLRTANLLSPFARGGFGMEEMLEDAVLFESEYVGIGCITASYFNMGLRGVNQYLEQAQGICGKIRKAGKTPVYDLQHHEFLRLPDGQWVFDKLLALDVLWESSLISLTRTGLNPPEVMQRLRPKLALCRLSDQKLRENQTYFFYANREECPLGEGVFPVPDWAAGARECGAGCFVVGQDLCDRDPFQCLKISLNYVNQIL